MPTPLHGIRVIDTTTGPAGGLATMVLAAFGADVIKVEPPGGDRFRSLPGSPLWLRGKRSVELDLHTEAGRARLHDLVRTADVVVVSGPPDRAARWGIDAGEAAILRPGIVHCSITGWGQDGPLASLPGYASTVAAKAGRMMAFALQIPREGPVYAALPVQVHVAAHAAVQGILSALIERHRTGAAQPVTTSLLQSLLPFDLVEFLLVQLTRRTGVAPSPNPASGAAMPTLNYHPVRTSDGRWIQCGNLLEHLFLSFLDAIELYGELLADPDGRYLDSPATWTPEAIDHARNRILETMQTKTADEWMAIFHANGNVAAEPFLTPAQALDHRDLVDNGAVVTLDDPRHGPVRMIGPIASLRSTPAELRPAPLAGEHTDAVLGALGPVPPALEANDSASPGRPLEGITVVEFASVIAAPLAASMLADLGARVIRVEPLEGDSYRHLLPHGLMAVKTNAGKESICLDLKREEARAIARSLIAKADVLIHNYRPGVPERLGIAYEQLRADRPGLVWVSVNGYGPNGPSAHRPATHPVAGASMGGAGYQAGPALTTSCDTLDDVREAARQLMRANESNPDPNTSVIIGSSALVALYHRERTGEGQAVYVDMLNANAHANADAFLSYEGMGARPAVDAELHGTGPCHRLYRARSGWVFLEVTTDDEWSRFAALAGVDEAARDDAAAIAAALAVRDAAEWEALLGAVGVACVRADEATPGNVYADSEQFRVNGFVPVTHHARFGEIRRWGAIVHVGGPAPSYGPGVLAGQDTDALLAELGHRTDDIAALRAAGIVTSEPTAVFGA